MYSYIKIWKVLRFSKEIAKIWIKKFKIFLDQRIVEIKKKWKRIEYSDFGRVNAMLTLIFSNELKKINNELQNKIIDLSTIKT